MQAAGLVAPVKCTLYGSATARCLTCLAHQGFGTPVKGGYAPVPVALQLGVCWQAPQKDSNCSATLAPNSAVVLGPALPLAVPNLTAMQEAPVGGSLASVGGFARCRSCREREQRSLPSDIASTNRCFQLGC